MLAMGSCSRDTGRHWVSTSSGSQQLCTVAEHPLNPGPLRCHLSTSACPPLPGVCRFPEEFPAHCRAVLTLTLVTPCSSTSVPPALEQFPGAPQCPLPILGRLRGQAGCGGPWHGSPCLHGLVYEGWESFGGAQPSPVPSGQRRSRSDNDLAQLVNLQLYL